MKVINGKTNGFIGEDKIYIGRANARLKLKASPLANPYFITSYRTDWKTSQRLRDEVIEQYKVLLWQSIKRCRDELIINGIMEELIRISQLDNAVLTCYCKPLPCHGDVIIDAIKWLKKQEWFLNYLF